MTDPLAGLRAASDLAGGPDRERLWARTQAGIAAGVRPNHRQPGVATRVTAVVVAVAVVGVAVPLTWGAINRAGGPERPPMGHSPTQSTSKIEPTAPTETSAPTQDSPSVTDPPVSQVIEPLVLPSLPQASLEPITVNLGELGPETVNAQKLADDVAAGDIESIVAKCWTQPASEVRQVYGSPAMRGAILQALRETPLGAQGGVIWEGQHVRLDAYWEEAKSEYPCPRVSWGAESGLGDFTPAMAQWRLTRALAVHDGTPVQPEDGTDYWVICDDQCVWHPHSTEDEWLTPPIVSDTDEQWDRLRPLSTTAELTVELLDSGFLRVRAADGSTDAVAYFTAEFNDYNLPFLLGEIG